MDFATLPQIAVGGTLFLASGYSVILAAFKKGELDTIELAVLSLAFSMMIPAIALLIANLLFQVRLDTLGFFAVYALITASALGYWHQFRRKK